MFRVADTDLSVDREPDRSKREVQRLRMWEWPGCLIRAIVHLHEMRAKHGYLKAANILVAEDGVLIADFGVPKDLIDEDTTASLDYAAAAAIPMYLLRVPEVYFSEGLQRRGRAV
jgi:serine/threonine protein kinase